MNDLIFIVGLSKFGAGCANYLSEAGKDVIVLDQNEASFDKLDPNFGGMKINGNALDLKFLEETEIKKANRVIVAVDNDNDNLFLANVFETIFKIPHVYVRLNKKGKERILKDTNIKPIYPYKLALDHFLDIFGDDNK